MDTTLITHVFYDGLYSAAYPNNWTCSEEDGNIAIADDRDQIAINITSFEADQDTANMAASYHLNRYLSRPDYESIEIDSLGENRSKGSYVDQDGRMWKVVFQSYESHLLLATLNASHNTPIDLVPIGECVLDSVALPAV